jgi:hypothetical protein
VAWSGQVGYYPVCSCSGPSGTHCGDNSSLLAGMLASLVATMGFKRRERCARHALWGLPVHVAIDLGMVPSNGPCSQRAVIWD